MFAQSRRNQEKQKEEPRSSSSKVILGDIQERSDSQSTGFSVKRTILLDDVPFPKVERIDRRLIKDQSSKGKSLFALSMEKGNQSNIPVAEAMEVDEEVEASDFDQGSFVSSSKEIHAENLQILAKMRKEEILEERAKLLQSVGKLCLNCYILSKESWIKQRFGFSKMFSDFLFPRDIVRFPNVQM